MSLYVGEASRYLRKKLGLKQKEMAAELGISTVHYCNIENSKSQPSPELLARYRELWEIDLHVLAWTRFGDLSSLPPALQKAAASIAETWDKELKRKLRRYRKVAD